MLIFKYYMCGCAVRGTQRLCRCKKNCPVRVLQPSVVSDGAASQADSEDKDEVLPAAIKPTCGRPFAASESTPNVSEKRGPVLNMRARAGKRAVLDLRPGGGPGKALPHHRGPLAQVQRQLRCILQPCHRRPILPGQVWRGASSSRYSLFPPSRLEQWLRSPHRPPSTSPEFLLAGARSLELISVDCNAENRIPFSHGSPTAINGIRATS